MKIELIKYPTEADWMFCKECTLVTVGKKAINPPTFKWKREILEAKHSPIRELRDREEIARMMAELTVLIEMLAIEYRVEELTGYWHLIVLSQIAKETGYGKH